MKLNEKEKKKKQKSRRCDGEKIMRRDDKWSWEDGSSELHGECVKMTERKRKADERSDAGEVSRADYYNDR